MSAAVQAAEVAVAESGRRLVSDLPFEDRWEVAREHEANLLRRAEVRSSAGVATFTDRRAIETARLRGFEAAAEAGIDAYGTRVLPVQGGAA